MLRNLFRRLSQPYFGKILGIRDLGKINLVWWIGFGLVARDVIYGRPLYTNTIYEINVIKLIVTIFVFTEIFMSDKPKIIPF